jgi:hypothetical protein
MPSQGNSFAGFASPAFIRIGRPWTDVESTHPVFSDWIVQLGKSGATRKLRIRGIGAPRQLMD